MSFHPSFSPPVKLFSSLVTFPVIFTPVIFTHLGRNEGSIREENAYHS